MDYPGKVITKNQVTPTQTSATGVWTLDDAAAAVKNNNWPVAGVPNPISRSLRFNSADSAYLNRTPASAGSLTTWTWSGWVKRGTISASLNISIFSAGTSGTNDTNITFNGDIIDWFNRNSSSINGRLNTTQVFRDPSGWYHLVFVWDTTNATASNRMRIYVNGSLITALSVATYPGSSQSSNINNNVVTYIGLQTGTSNYFNGYMTEINFIDGQALTPSSFGMTDPQTGAWIPIKYTGTYGTNGFYLNFKDATSTTTLGNDYSGNGNNWTTNNFSVTAGAGNDSLTDVPTPWIAYNTTGDVGGVVRGNYATFNPLLYTGSGGTKTDGNLQFAAGGTGGPPYNYSIYSTFTLNTGKWYWEMAISGASSQPFVGLFNTAVAFNGGSPVTGAGPVVYGYDGNYYNETSGVAFGSTYTAGDVIGIAVDFDNNLIWFSKNGTFQNSGVPASGTNGKSFGSGKTWGVGYVESGSSVNRATFVANFGQRPFAYTPPAGFLSLCTTNLPNPTIGTSTTTQAGKYFGINLWTGDGTTSRSLTGVGFQPDFSWIKARSGAYDHDLFDAVRGVSTTSTGTQLSSNLTAAEPSNTNGHIKSFDSDGFSIRDGTSVGEPLAGVNRNLTTYVAWNWNAGGSNATNTSGSITSTVRANTTAGFSIVTYTGTGVAATVGHGLGVAPSMVIVKRRDGSVEWPVYHVSVGNNKYLYLNTTAAAATFAMWNNTTPTSTVFSIGVASDNNANTGTYVAYCFAAVAGYSAFGSYTGNGTSLDGPFIYMNFRPRYFMIKRTDSTGGWWIYDSARNTYNALASIFRANNANAEDTDTTNYNMDFLSNGVKVRASTFTADGGMNVSGATYIYAAFAEFPFKFANAR